MQLGEAELVGAMDDDRIGGGNVDAGLDDRGAKQQIDALLVEVSHHPFQLALVHLSVRDRDARFGKERGELFAHAPDRVDVVVQEVDLSAALELAQRRFARDAG